jgi:hypothetical protein
VLFFACVWIGAFSIRLILCLFWKIKGEREREREYTDGYSMEWGKWMLDLRLLCLSQRTFLLANPRCCCWSSNCGLPVANTLHLPPIPLEPQVTKLSQLVVTPPSNRLLPTLWIKVCNDMEQRVFFIILRLTFAHCEEWLLHYSEFVRSIFVTGYHSNYSFLSLVVVASG